MSDDRLFSAFRLLDGPIEPETAYAERLFEALAGDLGFRPVARRAAIAKRFAGASPAVRLAYQAAVLGLLLAAAVAAALIAGALLRERTAVEIVAASQAMQLEPPAYDMTLSANGGATVGRVRMDGHGAWRWDWIVNRELSAGSFEVHDGTQVGRFDANTNTWTVSPEDRSNLDGALLTWALPHVPSETPSRPNWFTCPSWTRLADEIVAGRPAYHVACDDRQFWVDEASWVLVGAEAPAGQALGGLTGRATALEAPISFSPDTFAMAAPVGAFAIDPLNPPASTVLQVDHVAPRITGTTLDGKTFDTARLSEPLAVYVWGPWCDPCAGSHLVDLQTVAERHASTVATMTIAVNSNHGTVVGYVANAGIRLPVIDDGDAGPISTAWGIFSIPGLVMLDQNGVVAGIRAYPIAADDLEQMYAALEAGRPVPTPAPTPVRTYPPLPSLEPGATERMSGLDLGDPAPSWTGPLLGGGSLDGSSLLGKPTVIWFGLGCADCPTTDLESFEAAHRALGDSANLVAIAYGEPTPGWTAALFKRLGATVPLVYDWDGNIGAAFKLTFLGTVVLDGEGRVANLAPGGLSTEQILAQVQKLGGAPIPSQSP